MNVIPGEIIIDTAPRQPQPQPIAAISGEAPLDDNAVRQAIVNAEANNQDPQTITMSDFAQGQAKGTIPTPPSPAVATEPAAVVVPQKFLKPDGAVDVEKIAASTKQLDAAIQQKEEAVNKTVEDYLREYQERENKFRNLPNPEKLAANLPQPAPAPAPTPQGGFTQAQLEEIVRRDYQVDPLATTTRLIELALEQKFKPLQEREKMDAVRTNIQKLAEKDSRVLQPQIFEAINTKLNNDPDLWKLKDPHKAAWLEVKEELQLGSPNPANAQPRGLSPVLGGGSPPSAPSTSVSYNPEDVLANINRLDIRDKRQEELGDAAIRAKLMGNRG